MTLGTSPEPEGLTNPPLHELMNHADSKYSLLIFGAKRAKQINDYFLQYKEGLLKNVGPLVTYTDEQPLSIAFREINDGIVEGKLGSENDSSFNSSSRVMNDSIPLSVKDLSGSDEEDEDDMEEEEKMDEEEEGIEDEDEEENIDE